MAMNDDLAEAYIGHSVDLSKMSQDVAKKVVAHLEVMQAELASQITQAELAGQATQVKKLQNLLNETNATIGTAFSDAKVTLDDQLLEVAQYQAEALPKLSNDVFSQEVLTSSLTPKQLKQIATNPIIEGSPADYWWKHQEQKTKAGLVQAVRLGLSLGENTDKIVARTLGERTGWKTVELADSTKKRIGTYSGGPLNVTRREAQALVLTAVSKVANDTQEEVFKENQDVLKGRQALATLDGRTSEICRARSGGAWDFDGKPLKESRIKIPFPGLPPWHIRCRTIIVPITKSWEELSGERIIGLPEFKPNIQASMDGQVSADMNYEDWFKKQVLTKGDTWGAEVMGAGKYQLWKDGKVGMADMVDFSGNPVSLAALKQKLTQPATAGKADVTGLSGSLSLTQPQLDKFQERRKEWQQYDRQMVMKYRDESSAKIDSALAAGKVVPGSKGLIAAMDKATSKPLGEDLTLWHHPSPDFDISSIKPGDTISQKGYAMSTASPEKARDGLLESKSDVLFKIQATAGAKTGYIEGPDLQNARFAFARDSQMKVVGVKETTVDIPQQSVVNGKLVTTVTTKKVKIVELSADGSVQQSAPKPVPIEVPKSVPTAPLKPKPAPVSEPPKPAPVLASGFPAQEEKLTVVKKLGGSTGAELVRDSFGRQFVRKYGADQGHLEEEFYAENAYRAAGANVPASQLYTDPQGKKYKLAEFIEGKTLGQLMGADRAVAETELQRHFAADALIGNWDVVGMSHDNVLVSADGKVFRIDVGGSFRYRAQGVKKTADQWNGYPTELWTMRDSKISPQVASAMKTLTHQQILEQAQGIIREKQKILDSIPEELRPIVSDRITSYEKMVMLSGDFFKEGFEDDYVSTVAKHQMGIRKAEVTAGLSTELTLSGKGFHREKLWNLADENGKPWDNLRGPNSASSKFWSYLDGQDPVLSKILSRWMDAQSYSSWEKPCLRMKATIVQKLKVDPNEFFWNKSSPEKAAALLKKSKYSDRYSEALAAFQAVTYEKFLAINLPNVNKTSRSVKLVRTETVEAIQENKMQKNAPPKEMTRGAAESFSLFHRVRVKGSEVTIQEIPFSRVLGSYLTSRPGPHSIPESSGFLTNEENELLAIGRGSKVSYITVKKWEKLHYIKPPHLPYEGLVQAPETSLVTPETSLVTPEVAREVIQSIDHSQFKKPLNLSEITQVSKILSSPNTQKDLKAGKIPTSLFFFLDSKGFKDFKPDAVKAFAKSVPETTSWVASSSQVTKFKFLPELFPKGLAVGDLPPYNPVTGMVWGKSAVSLNLFSQLTGFSGTLHEYQKVVSSL